MASTSAPTLRSPRIYAIVLAFTVLAVGLGAWRPASLQSSAFVVLLVAVVLTGMPHGAIDHLVAAKLYGLRFTWADQAKFYAGYLVLMALYGGLWIVAPVWSLMIFLVMTMYHFGQADLAYWGLPPFPARLLYLSRGLLLIGGPIAAFPTLVDPIFEAIAGVQVSAWPLLSTRPDWVFAALVGQHGLAAAGSALACGAEREKWGREALNIPLLSALFGVVPPLVAFSVYFGLWHSLGHILELLRFFRRRGGTPTTFSAFYREAALFTVLPFVGLAVLYGLTQSFGLQDRMIALLFIIIAVMTLPHMVIVERLYREREDRRGVAA
ncbi:MAG: Brp/Blh family beta-carotene 15,15'-dioxygenase [Salinibacter sp.]